MIAIEQRITREDYRRAAFLHLRPRPAFGLAGLLLLSLSAFCLVLQLRAPLPWKPSTLIMLSCMLYLAVFFFVIIPRRINRAYSQNRFLDHSARCRIDESGLHTQSDLGSSDIPWDHFHKWKENKRLVLLYPTDTMYFIFPRRLFDAEGWEELRTLAGTRLKKIR